MDIFVTRLLDIVPLHSEMDTLAFCSFYERNTAFIPQEFLP